MRYMTPQYQQPITPQYYPPQQMGYLGQTASPIPSTSWWILGGIALGLYLWSSSERSQSKWF